MANRRPGLRATAVALVFAVAAAGVVYVRYGVESMADVFLLAYFAPAAAAAVVLVGLRGPWPFRVVCGIGAAVLVVPVLLLEAVDGAPLGIALVGLVAVAVGVRSGWREPVALVLALLGVSLFALEAGGTVSCNLAGYPDGAGYGLEYHWRTGDLYYGDNIDGDGYRCVTDVDLRLAALGYLLAVVGTVKTTDSDGDS